MSTSTIISTTVVVLLIAILFLIMSRFSLSFKPFSFKILEPFRGIGWVFIALGVSFTEYSAQKKGRDDFFEKVKKTIESIDNDQEEVKDLLKQNKELNIKLKSTYEKLKNNGEQ